jgi:hypothetical protein
MLSISQLFSSSKENKDHPYIPRHINLSGNIVSFSIPENFSLDFPADNLVEDLNINNQNVFAKNNSFTLLRRWCDFKDNSFFSKNMGTMMMTIHVYKTNDSSVDISHPIGFIKTLLLEMERRDKEENEERSESDKVYFPEFYQSFIEKMFNNQKWLRGGAADTNETQMAFHEWKQITPDHYLGVEFHFAPNSNIRMRTFLDTYCRDMLEKIMSTFDIIYSNENPIKLKLENNSQLNLKQLIEELD